MNKILQIIGALTICICLPLIVGVAVYGICRSDFTAGMWTGMSVSLCCRWLLEKQLFKL